MNKQQISQIVQDLFPSFLNEESPLFIHFVEAYYQWMEQEGNTQHYIDNITDTFDVDKAADEFLDHFRLQYLASVTFNSNTEQRAVLKHARDFLSTKGTAANIVLLMQLVYGIQARVTRPKDQVLRASDGQWYVPTYLELSPSERTSTFEGRLITGATSGATAIAERVVRKSLRGYAYDVLYITNVTGTFKYQELITSDGLLDNCPSVIGSLTSIDLTNGGKDFNVGDVVDVVSQVTGRTGKARVTETGAATGRVTFDLQDGGWGFTANAEVYVSDKVLNLSNRTPNPAANATYQDFLLLEEVIQPMQTISVISSSGAFAVNNYIQGYSATNAVVAQGRVIGIPSALSSGFTTIKVLMSSAGTFANATTVGTIGNTVLGVVDTVQQSSAKGVVIGSSNTGVISGSTSRLGISAIRGVFTSNTPYAFIRGITSNTYANVFSLSAGSGAGFEVGSLADTESVFINIDRLGGNNLYNQPYLRLRLAGTGFIGDVVVANSISNSTVVYYSQGGTDYVEGDIQPLIFTGGSPTVAAQGVIIVANGVIKSIASNLSERGSGYTNGQVLSFSTTPTRTVTASLNPNEQLATISIGNTHGMYVGLSVTGNNIPPNTSITAIDADLNIIYLNQPPIAEVEGVVLSFPAAGYITTTVSGNVASITLTSQGLGYTSAPTVSVSGAGSGAVLSAAIANGVVVDTRMDEYGANYNGGTLVVSATTTGVSANLVAQLDSGYGFPKLPESDLSSVISTALTKNTYSLGSLASITGINLGAGYNQDPFVLVIEPVTVGFDRRDVVVQINKQFSNFVVGELVTQSYTSQSTVLNYINLTGGTFTTGQVLKMTSGLTIMGYVIVKNVQVTTSTTGSITLDLTMVGSPADGYSISGFPSGATAVIDSVILTDDNNVRKGRVKEVGEYYITLERLSFDLNYDFSIPLEGSTSGESVLITSVSNDQNALPIGMNANVSAQAGTVQGFITSVQVFDSGLSYRELEAITLQSADNDYVASGYARLKKQGVGEGFFVSRRGFLNSESYLHDSNYYQDFSYVVRTGISSAVYNKVLTESSHTAGTKMFGAVELVNEAVTNLSAQSSIGAASSKRARIRFVPSSNVKFSQNESVLVNSTFKGLADITTQVTSTSASGYSNIKPAPFRNIMTGQWFGSNLFIPTVASPQYAPVILTSEYNALLNTTTVTLDTAVPAGTIQAQYYADDVVYPTTSPATFSNGDIVTLISNTNSSVLANPYTLNTLFNTTRNTYATYKDASNNLVYALPNVLRVKWTANSISGFILEQPSVNWVANSDVMSYFVTSGSTIAANSVVVSPWGYNNYIIQPMRLSVDSTSLAVHTVRDTNNPYASQTAIVSGSVFVKPGQGYDYVWVGVGNSPITSPRAAVRLNMTTTTIADSVTIGGSASIVNTYVEGYANGWIRVGLTVSADWSTGGAKLFLALTPNNSLALNDAWSETNTSNHILFTGGQLEPGKVTSYIPTFNSKPQFRARDFLAPTFVQDTTTSSVGANFMARTAMVQNTISTPVTGVYTRPQWRAVITAGSNTGPLIPGSYLYQYQGNYIASKSVISYSSYSGVSLINEVGNPSTYYGKFYDPNTYVLSVISNNTSQPTSLVPGEQVVQMANATAVSAVGYIHFANQSVVIVTNTSNAFSNSVGTVLTLKGKVSDTNVFVTNATMVSVGATSVTRSVPRSGWTGTANVSSNGFLVSLNSNSGIISATRVENATANLISSNVTLSSTINTIDLVNFQGLLAVGSTITGETTGASATVTSVQII